MNVKEKTPAQRGKDAAEWLDTIEDAREYARDEFDSQEDQEAFVSAYEKAKR